MGERENIFLVDDDSNLVDTLKELLERDGHKVVVVAGSVAEVETILQEEGEDFQIAIVDNKMPCDGDGKRAALLIREKKPGVIIYSHAAVLQDWGDKNFTKGQYLSLFNAIGKA